MQLSTTKLCYLTVLQRCLFRSKISASLYLHVHCNGHNFVFQIISSATEQRRHDTAPPTGAERSRGQDARVAASGHGSGARENQEEEKEEKEGTRADHGRSAGQQPIRGG